MKRNPFIKCFASFFRLLAAVRGRWLMAILLSLYPACFSIASQLNDVNRASDPYAIHFGLILNQSTDYCFGSSGYYHIGFIKSFNISSEICAITFKRRTYPLIWCNDTLSEGCIDNNMVARHAWMEGAIIKYGTSIYEGSKQRTDAQSVTSHFRVAKQVMVTERINPSTHPIKSDAIEALDSFLKCDRQYQVPLCFIADIEPVVREDSNRSEDNAIGFKDFASCIRDNMGAHDSTFNANRDSVTANKSDAKTSVFEIRIRRADSPIYWGYLSKPGVHEDETNYDIDISPDGKHWFHLFNSYCENGYPKVQLIYKNGTWLIIP